MKLITAILAPFIWLSCFGQPEFTKDKQFHIKNVLRENPAAAEKLWMKCTSGDIARLRKNTAMFANLKEIAIIGGDETSDWAGALTAMSSIKPLTKVIFIKNEFGEVPASAVVLQNVQSISFYGSPLVDFESSTTLLSSLSNLQDLNLDLLSVDDVPKNLGTLENLRSVSFSFSSNLLEKDTTVAFEEMLIPVSEAGSLSSVKLRAAKNSLKPEDINAVLTRFPGADYEDTWTNQPSGTNASTRTPDITYDFEPTYENIHPPVKGLNVEKKSFKALPASATTLKLESGTTINIPANAFVDENGNAVTGDVRIDYREYNDPLDFIFSGIPMSFDSAGHTSQFVSAGMFEINASSEGKKVYLKKGEKINMDFASMDKAPDYNLYAFNDETGKWEERVSKATIPVSVKPLFESSRAVQIYNYYRNLRSRSLSVMMVDSTPLEERFNDPSYIYTRKLRYNPDGRSADKNDKEIKSTSYIAMAKIRHMKDGTYFTLLNKTASSAAYYTHPELAAFSSCKWKLNTPLSKEELMLFRKRKIAINDVRIKQDGDEFTITLKTSKGFREISASLVRINSKGKVKEINAKEGRRMYRKYSKMLAFREKKFNKMAKDRKANFMNVVLHPEDYSHYGWTLAKGLMNDTEKKLGFEEWEQYADEYMKNEKNNLSASQANGETIMRSFQIDGMGIWNCDQIRRLTDPVEIFIQYKNADQKSIYPKQTFVISKNLNGVLSFQPSQAVAISETHDNIMITVGKDGELAVAYPDSFKGKKFKNNGKYPILLNELDAKTTSVSDLKKLIDL